MPDKALFAAAGLLALSACGLPGEIITARDQPTPIAVTVTTPAQEQVVVCTTVEPAALFGDADADLLWEVVGEPAAGSDGAFGAAPRALAELPTPDNGGLARNTDGTLSVTLRYRDDLVWSDGQPFTAHDALLGIQSAAPPDVLDAEVTDGHTLSLTLAREAGFPYVPDAPPLPSHALEGLEPEAIANSAYAERIDPALGPYVMQGWTRGESVTLTANPYYPDGEPVFAAMQIRFVVDSATLVSDLLSGACDVAAEGLSSADLPALQQGEQQGQARLVTGPGLLWDHLDFNATPTGDRVPFFADVRVRQAAAQAINREALAQLSGLDSTPVMESWLPAQHWAYPADPSSLAQYPYDPARAQSLLSEAGWRDANGDGTVEYRGQGGEYGCLRGAWQIEEETPFNVSLITSQGDPLREGIANQIKADLGAVGIEVAVQVVEPGALFSRSGPLARRDFDMALFAWPTTPDPGGLNWWLGADIYRHPLSNEPMHTWQIEDRFERATIELLAPSNIPSPANDYHGQNLTGWCDETADLAIFQAARAVSLSERQAAYAQQQVIFSQQAPTLPLFQRPRIVATRPEICGVAPGPYAPVTWNAAAWTYDPTGACGS